MPRHNNQPGLLLMPEDIVLAAMPYQFPAFAR
jgi:hypothetical protein